MRKFLIAVPVAALALSACSATTNYKNKTEDFINDNSQVESRLGGDVTDAVCEEPANTDVGTKYSCTANVGDTQFTITSEITAENEFTITSANPT